MNPNPNKPTHKANDELKQSVFKKRILNQRRWKAHLTKTK